MTKVTSDQAYDEYLEWVKIRNKEGNSVDLVWEFCAELLEVNHQFYNKLNRLEDNYSMWARWIVSSIFKRENV